MSLKDRITADMKEALKSGDKARLGVIRMLRSKLQDAEVKMRAKEGPDYTIDDAHAQDAIGSYAKQRRESIESYRNAGREDLAAKEEAELAIIADYLPEQLSEEALREIVAAAIHETGASTPRDLGNVMKAVMPKVKGRADGKLINRLVREGLSGEAD